MNTRPIQASSQLVVILVTVCLAVVAGKLAIPVHAQETERPSAPQFTVKNPYTVQDGSFQLSWSLPHMLPLPFPVYFQLQESTEQDFVKAVTINVGSDQGIFVSGLPNGSYFYRVRMVDSDNKVLSQWSAPARRNVKHHSLTFALSLMIIGGVVFFSTVVMVLNGIKRRS